MTMTWWFQSQTGKRAPNSPLDSSQLVNWNRFGACCTVEAEMLATRQPHSMIEWQGRGHGVSCSVGCVIVCFNLARGVALRGLHGSLNYLDVESKDGKNYLKDMQWCTAAALLAWLRAKHCPFSVMASWLWHMLSTSKDRSRFDLAKYIYISQLYA